MLVFVVTKNVREELRIWLTSEFRRGFDIAQGLKPSPFLGEHTARLKSCPDTKQIRLKKAELVNELCR
jgi:hypothetical protein